MPFHYNDLSTRYLLKGLLAMARQDEGEARNAAANIEKYATDPNLKPEFAAGLKVMAAQVRDHAEAEAKFRDFLQGALKELEEDVGNGGQTLGTARRPSEGPRGEPILGRAPPFQS